MNIIEVYCITDEVMKQLLKKNSTGRRSKLTESEAITILVMGHFEGLTTAKQIYNMVSYRYPTCFRNIPSYAQFTRMICKVLPYLDQIIDVFITLYKEHKHTLLLIDSTSLPVGSHNRTSIKWADGHARIGKNMHGWYTRDLSFMS